VIGFDADGRGQILTSDAVLPDEFVEPIVAWLDRRPHVERCAETTCG